MLVWCALLALPGRDPVGTNPADVLAFPQARWRCWAWEGFPRWAGVAGSAGVPVGSTVAGWETAAVSSTGLVIGWRTGGRSVFGWYRHGAPIMVGDVDADGRAVVVVEAGCCLVPRRPSRYERKQLGIVGRRALVIETSSRLPFPDLSRQREIYIATRIRFVVGNSDLVGVGARS